MQRPSPLDQRCRIAARMSESEMDLARIVSFDSFRAHRWLMTIAGPDQKLYGFLRRNGVDLNQVIHLLHGAIALWEWSFGGPKEDCIFLPVMDDDGITPIDVAMFSMGNPARFGTMLGLGVVLGQDQVINPASYWGSRPCLLLASPLEWLRKAIESCAVVLDPAGARSVLDWAPGDLAAQDHAHADYLVAMGAVDPKRLVVPVRRAA
jgi:hypothetical protein